MKKFSNLILESDDPSKYTEVTDQIKELIENTIENSGGEFKTFVESYIKNPSDVKIEGVINDSDVYHFHHKNRKNIEYKFI